MEEAVYLAFRNDHQKHCDAGRNYIKKCNLKGGNTSYLLISYNSVAYDFSISSSLN